MEILTDEAKERIQETLDDAFEYPDKVTSLQSSLELHMFATNWNWDNGTKEPLFRVIQDSRCDKGTALRLYWAGDPLYFYETYANRDEVEEYHQQNYDLLKDIEKRLIGGFYTEQNICFDPHSDWIPGLTSSDNLKQHIPEVMLESTPGVKVEGEDEFYN
ncbi:MAG TPA: DUF4274 domain-containing protein [Abditibacteriaceae bacterium]|jgi:hypothetical protein